MLAEVQLAEEMGIEGGGVLIGCFPKSIGPPLLRIEEFEAVGRRHGDGRPFILSAEQRQRFTGIKKKVATRELSAVGYFRSHLRTGPFELSVGDRDFMSAEFRNTIHLALLIARDHSSEGASARARHLATYFVSVNGIIQNRVDPMTFPFGVAELQRLAVAQPAVLSENQAQPKLVSDEPQETSPAPEQRDAAPPFAERHQRRARISEPPPSRFRRFVWASTALLALLSATFIYWAWSRQGIDLPGTSSRLGLRLATGESGVPGYQAVHVTWNHASPVVANATKAVLMIVDRETHQKIREFELGSGDLTAGSVKVVLANRPVEITLTFWMPDSTRVIQVAEVSS
jgi:hypothetical protein